MTAWHESVTAKGELKMTRADTPLDFVEPAGLEHVVADHRVVVHDDGVVRLDEAHASHIRGEVEHVVASLCDREAVVQQAQVDEVELVAEHVLLWTRTRRGDDSVDGCTCVVAAAAAAAAVG